MRPVDKGEAPQEYTQYKDAEKDLEARLGAYCSFCEMAINHAPEVRSQGQGRCRTGMGKPVTFLQILQYPKGNPCRERG